MSRFRFSHRVTVRFADCDPMAHVNHATYFTFCEEARFEYWRTVLGDLIRREPLFILARAECDFRAQARPGDVIDVGAGVTSLGRSSFVMEYALVRAADQVLVANAKTVQVMFDYAAQRSRPLREDVRQLIEAYENRDLGSGIRDPGPT